MTETIPDFGGAVTSETVLPEPMPGEWENLTVPFSQIPPISATALWPGVVPNRTVTVIAAPGGTGKGLVIAKIAAITSTGEPFPGQSERREPGQVVMVAPEDDANEDLAFRLRAAGADTELVRNLTVLPNGALFRYPDNEPELRQAIAEINEEGGPPVKLVALDPLSAMTKASTLRSDPRVIIEPLQNLAAETGTALIASHHTTKDKNVVAGGQALVDAARRVWLIKRVPGDPDTRVMTVYKSNRRPGPAVRYRIEGDDEDARVVFTGPDSAAPGSRAAKLRLAESPEVIARRWLDAHPEQESEETP